MSTAVAIRCQCGVVIAADRLIAACGSLRFEDKLRHIGLCAFAFAGDTQPNMDWGKHFHPLPMNHACLQERLACYHADSRRKMAILIVGEGDRRPIIAASTDGKDVFVSESEDIAAIGCRADPLPEIRTDATWDFAVSEARSYLARVRESYPEFVGWEESGGPDVFCCVDGQGIQCPT